MALNESDSVSLTAFIVSLVALIVSFLQFTQSTFLTAEGSRRCKPSVIGKWSKLAHKHFIWSELRFEQTFTAPKIQLLDLSDQDFVRTIDLTRPENSNITDDSLDTVQYVHERNISIHPKKKEVRAAAHVLSWNSLPNNIETCWKRNEQTDGKSSKWNWLRAVGNVFIKLINALICVMEDYHEAGLGKDIGISWDALLRHIYLYQSCSYSLQELSNTSTFVDAITENSIKGASETQHQNGGAEEKVPTSGGLSKTQNSLKPKDRIGTVAAVMLQRHTWDLLPSDVVRPLAQAELGAILVLAQRLNMRWREIDIIRGSLRADADGCSITSTFVSGFGIVLQFNQSKKFRPVQLINNRHVDKIMCGIVPGCAELGLRDIEVVSDSRDVADSHRRFLGSLGFDDYLYIDKTRTLRPYWSQTLLNDGTAFYCPFLPTEGSPVTRAPNAFGWDGPGLVATTEYADSVQLLRVKLREQHKTAAGWSPTAWPIKLMNRLHDECEPDFYHRVDALRHRDLVSPDLAHHTSQQNEDLQRLANQKLNLLEKLRDVHTETTHYFAVLQRRNNNDQADKSAAFLRQKHLTPPDGKLRYMDLVRAHLIMQADAIRLFDKVIDSPRIDDIRSRIKANGDYKSHKHIDNPLIAIVDEFQTEHVRRKLREARAYSTTDMTDEQIAEAWWMMIVRGISWRMSVELAGPPWCAVAPASLYGSDMPVWLT